MKKDEPMPHVIVAERGTEAREYVVGIPNGVPIATFIDRTEADECCARVNWLVDLKIKRIIESRIDMRLCATFDRIEDLVHAIADQEVQITLAEPL